MTPLGLPAAAGDYYTFRLHRPCANRPCINRKLRIRKRWIEFVGAGKVNGRTDDYHQSGRTVLVSNYNTAAYSEKPRR